MANPAETYEREMVPALFGPWAPLLIELTGIHTGESVLDLACGTGIVARHAARCAGSDGRVVGLDINPDMLEVARDAAAREGLAIEWELGQMESLPFGADEFDVALCQHGLQFVPDRQQALAQTHRVLRPGGRLALAAWQGLDRHPLRAAFNEALVNHLGIPALAGAFSLSADELSDVLGSAGFRDIAIADFCMPARFTDPARFVAMEIDVIAAAIPATQHLDERARAELVEAVSRDLEEPVRQSIREGAITIRMYANLARAVS